MDESNYLKDGFQTNLFQKKVNMIQICNQPLKLVAHPNYFTGHGNVFRLNTEGQIHSDAAVKMNYIGINLVRVCLWKLLEIPKATKVSSQKTGICQHESKVSVVE